MPKLVIFNELLAKLQKSYFQGKTDIFLTECSTIQCLSMKITRFS